MILFNVHSPWLGLLICLAWLSWLVGQGEIQNAAGQDLQYVKLDCDELTESSGVAVSLRDPKFIWSHNDSGGQPRLYRFHGQTGRLQDVFELPEALNQDWEDICSFELDGKQFLAVGDIGDNLRRRKQIEICIVEEPGLAELRTTDAANDKLGKQPRQLELITKLQIRYPERAFDCEALAFDPQTSRLLLVTKEALTCRLMVVPLDLSSALARTDETAKDIVYPAQFLQSLPLSMITGADIDPTTNRLVLCNYGGAYLVQPNKDTPGRWDAGSLQRLESIPKRRQGEAIAFAGPEHLVLTSEGSPTPLWTLRFSEQR